MAHQLISQSHYCHVPGCSRVVDPKFLMCHRHWELVPLNLKNRIYQHYRTGQEIDKNPTDEYLQVAELAINSVLEKLAKL